MAVVVGEAAVRIRPDVDEGEFRDEVSGPVGDSLEEAGGIGAAKFTAAFGAALAIGGAFAESLEQAALGDKLAASLGASGQYAEDLGSIAGGLYADAYGESLGDVNDALKSVIQSGAVMEDASNEQLSSVTASVMDLATAMDQDVGGTSQAVGRMIQTGLAANAEEALDILTRGFQQGADRGGDLLDVVGEYGTTFTELGLTGGQSIGLLNQALAAGIPNADFAADALREMGIIGREGGEAAAAAVDSLGLSSADYFAAMQAGGPQATAALDSVLDALRSTEDPALRSAAATALVGTQYEDLGDAILSLDPSEATASLGQVEGAAASMGDTLNDNASTRLTEFSRGLQQAFVDVIGGKVIPFVDSLSGKINEALGPALEWIKGVIDEDLRPIFEDFKGWLEDNEQGVKNVATAISVILAPALIRLGIQAITSGAMTVVGWAMSTAGAIGAGIVYVAQSALIVARWVLMGITAIVQGAIIAGVWTAQIVASAISGAAAFGLQVARVVAGWVLMGTQSLIQAGRMAAAWLIAMGPVGIIIALVIGLVVLIIANWQKVKDFTVNAFNAIKDKVVGAFHAVVDAVRTGVSSAVDFVRSLPGKILSAIGNFGSLLYNKGRDLIKGLVNGIASAASFVGNIARNVVNAIIGFINDQFITKLNNSLDFTIMGIHVNPPDIPRIPKLHSGGVFDSGQGEGLALLRDDELVATPEQRRTADDLLRGLLDGRLPGGPREPGQYAAVAGTNVQIDVHPAPGMDERVLAAHVGNDLGWQLSSGATRPVALLGGTS